MKIPTEWNIFQHVPDNQAVLVKHSETIYHALNEGWLKHVETMVHSQFSSIPGDRCVGASASTDATPPAVRAALSSATMGDLAIRNMISASKLWLYQGLPGIQKLNPCFCWISEKWWFNQQLQGLRVHAITGNELLYHLTNLVMSEKTWPCDFGVPICFPRFSEKPIHHQRIVSNRF